MPVCRALLKYGVCKEADCLFKHSLDDIKECNMYKLGFCIYGPQCRYKHTRSPGMTFSDVLLLYSTHVRSNFAGMNGSSLDNCSGCFELIDVGATCNELERYSHPGVSSQNLQVTISEGMFVPHSGHVINSYRICNPLVWAPNCKRLSAIDPNFVVIIDPFRASYPVPRIVMFK